MFRTLIKGLPILGRLARPVGVTAAKAARTLTPAEISAAQKGIQSFTGAGAAKTPNILARILRKGGGVGKVRKLPLIAGGLAGLGLAGRTLYGGDEGPGFQYTPQDIESALGGGADNQRLMAEYYNQMRSQIAGQDQKAFEDYQALQQQHLQDYLAGIGGYSAAQGAAIEQAYQNLADQSRAMAEQAMSESQLAATDIDRLYGEAAASAAGYGAGEGLTTGTSDVSGLTGVSGGMAEAPDVTRTYGQSLADWMGRQGIIQRQDLESAAQSYLAQGLGTKSQMQAEAEALRGRAQYDLASRLADMQYQQQQQRAAQLFALDQQYQQAMLEGRVADAEQARAAGLLSLQAPRLWEEIKADPGTQNMWEALGVTDAESLAAAIRQRPELTQLLGV